MGAAVIAALVSSCSSVDTGASAGNDVDSVLGNSVGLSFYELANLDEFAAYDESLFGLVAELAVARPGRRLLIGLLLPVFLSSFGGAWVV